MATLLSRASLRTPFLSNFCTHLSLFNHSFHTNPPSADQFLSLLPFCRKSQDLKALNSLLLVHGFIGHKQLVKEFVNRCCHLGFPDLALSVFTTIQKPSLYLQNLFLRSLCDNGFFEDVVFAYKKCRNSGSSSDNYTYPFVIKASTALRNVCFGNMMHCVVLKAGFGDNLVVQTALLGWHLKVGEMGNARKVFDEISQPDLITWNTLISGYSVNGCHYEAIQVFQDVRVMGVKPNPSTLASVLHVCSRIRLNDFGISLHGLAFKLGSIEEELLLPALVSIYANSGNLLAAREIFDTSTKKDLAIWNAIIAAYTRNHKPENAVGIFQTMLLDEMKPDMVTFVSLLPSSQILGNIQYVGSFHAHVIKFGFEKELSVVTALVPAYAKLGDIDSVEFLFHNVQKRNILLWNSMLSAYCGHGLCIQSFGVLRLMQMDGFIPDAISTVSVLSSCSELKATLLGKSAHAFFIRKSIDSNLNVSNALLAFYCNCSELVYSFRIFDRMILQDVVSWNTMISGSVNHGELELAIHLFHHMRQEGVRFDLVTLISILPSFHELQNPQLGFAIHGYAIRSGLTADISLANALVSMYVNCGELNAARLFFDDMKDKSVVSWNAILAGYRYYNLLKETIELFHDMIGEYHNPNYVTLLNVLPACETLGQGKSIHGYAIRRMIPLETPLLTSLMITYARYENLRSCLILFGIGDKTSISLWNTNISALLLMKKYRMAFSFFCKLLRNETDPDDITVMNLISTCVHLNNLQMSNFVVAYLFKNGFDKDVAISNALIDMYAKCGSITCARILFDMLPQKNSVSWGVIINGYGLHGDGVAALNLYSRMMDLGLKPDKVTYMTILFACSHAGYVEQGRMVFDDMIRNGILPEMEHYGCMVDMLGRRGHLNEAYEIVKNLPGEPSRKLLESVLGACLSNGDYGLGEEIGRLLVDMNGEECGAYVILHNIYAAAGKWVDANNVRMLMEHKQFCKAPGLSFVDGSSVAKISD